MALLEIPIQVWLGQLLLGLINGAFYAMLSLGLALIYGLLQIGNFTHGALYMMGAFVAWWLLTALGIGYWPALSAVAALGRAVRDRDGAPDAAADLQSAACLRHAADLRAHPRHRGRLPPGLRDLGLSYPVPEPLRGGWNLGFMFLPIYRSWVILASIIVCSGIWWLIERTLLGATLRAATENPLLTRALGIKVPQLITLTFGLGVALAAFAGVMAAPIFQVNPLMGANLVIIGFAVVVIGGVGSVLGTVVAGFGVGVIEGLAKVIYPQASTTIIFVLMAVVLLVRPAGLFGRTGGGPVLESAPAVPVLIGADRRGEYLLLAVLLVLAMAAPFVVYPAFLMKALCFALFASSSNLLIGYVGLLSFGHAAFFGGPPT